MTKNELKDELKNRISFALKDPMLQQGFEIICKENAELKKRNGDLAGQKASLERWFGEAKEIIKDLLSLKASVSSAEDVIKRFSVRERAEKFLKENEE